MSTPLESFERDAPLTVVCRGGYCTLAALVLYDYYNRNCEIWGLYEKDKPGIRHFFVRVNGWAVDMGGARTLVGMRRIYPGEIYFARRISKRQLDREHTNNTYEHPTGSLVLAAEESGNEIVRRRIMKHLNDKPEWFSACLNESYPFKKRHK